MSTGRNDAQEIVIWFYNLLEKRLTPEALNTLLKRGIKARGSKSVHGFMLALLDVHEQRKRHRPAPTTKEKIHVSD